LRGDRKGVTGQRFRLPAGAALREQPFRASVPLLIGTWGPRLARIAGEMAEEVKIGGTANPEMVPLMRRWVAEGERTAGRPPNGARIVVGAVTVVDEDGGLARTKAQREVVMYLDVVGALDRTFEFPPGLLERIRDEFRVAGAEAAGRLVPDEVLDRFAFAGTPDAVAERALEVLHAGADRIDFGTPHGATDDGGLELLGAKVLPAIREATRG
jgi:5,10-methylenetetrahydromethanopterin reductase